MTPKQIGMIRAGLPLDVPSFAEALKTKRPVFIDGWDPERDRIENTDVFGPVCIYPLVVNGEVRGLFTVGLRVGVQWQDRDRALMRALGRSLTLALERTEAARLLQERNAELEARTRALESFADLTRDLSALGESAVLVKRAQEVVLSLVPPGYAVYLEPEDGLWRLRSQVGAMRDPALQVQVDAGLPFDTPQNLLVPFQTRQPYYQDVYDRETDRLGDLAREVGSTAALPVWVGGEVVGVFGTVLFDPRGWTRVDRAVLETVVRSLGLALERAHSVAQLEAQRQTLAAANEELEAFAYSVSHDLRTPVRHITSFNDLLRKSLGDRLDDKAARYLGIVGEAAGRMNVLIDAMLDLSRTSRLPLRVGAVDLGALVAGVRAELEPETLERHLRWQVGPLPLVSADHDLLHQVIENLLHNAVKYTRTRDEAQIEVWAEEHPGEWAVFVRDNGVGFDPRYADRLFGVFQRLHRQEEFEGTGVGLANVRRIIARHGGRVWAQGVPGAGATFGFTLPKPR